MKPINFLAALFLILAPLGAIAAPAAMSTAQNAFDFSFNGIDGKPMPLAEYKGKVLMVVNTASRCGFTPQYEGLQTIYQKYKDKGFVVIAVPSNNFAEQEPGSEAEIKKFSSEKYNVTFPLTAKNDVKGDAAHPFFKWAAGQNVGGFLNTAPTWNFHKYLIGRNGQVLESYSSMTKPESSEVTDAIEKALAENN